MSKNYADKNVNKVLSQSPQNNSSEKEFVNSRGLKVTLLPLPPYLIEMATSVVKAPPVPTYDIVLEGGGIETHTHDAESIEQSSDEEKLKWTQYLIEKKKANAASVDVLMKVILIEGVRVEIPDRDNWIKRQKLMGLPVPEDEEELMLMFKKTQVVGNDKDIEYITQYVMQMSNVAEEDIKVVKDSFQDNVESNS